MKPEKAIVKVKDIMIAEIDRIPSYYDAEVEDEIYSDTYKIDEILKLNKVVCEALEKQIPKKPINYDSVPHSRCPVCNNSVKIFEDAHEYHYCLYCGQLLDWSEEI